MGRVGLTGGGKHRFQATLNGVLAARDWQAFKSEPWPTDRLSPSVDALPVFEWPAQDTARVASASWDSVSKHTHRGLAMHFICMGGSE